MRKLLFIALFLPLLANARKFYFSSSTGSDSYTISQAQNQSTPWRTLQKLQQQVVGGVVCFAAGDTIAFKRGDIFDNGYTRFSTPNYYTFASCSWTNDPAEGWTAPSGTPSAPIVFTSYGDVSLPKPNFYYPLAETPITNASYNVLYFSGVHDIIIDGLQFDDTRFPIQDKSNPAYTRTAIIFGEWTQSKVVGTDTIFGSNRDTANRKRMITNGIIKNCFFNNISFGIINAGINCKFQNNTITNLKSTVDTTGFTDIGSGAFEALYGFNNEFSNNYIKGAWSRTGRVSDGNGLMGVAFDIFCLKNSKFINNTIIDCSGTWEIGNTDRYDTLSGAWYDTFAYNKVINCGQCGYIHGSPGDVFSGNNRNIGCFNNIVINNNSSRISGPNFGWDLYNDGQSFRGNSLGQYAWWFFRSPTKCPNNFFQTGSVTNGSATVIIPTAGIQIGSRLYDADENGAYKEVIAIGSGQVTVAAPFTVTNSSYSFNIYAPLSDLSWSYPINPPYCNWNGHRYVVQYASDNIRGNADTLVDLRNNIIYATTGDQFIYDVSRTKQKHINNIYYIKGAFLNPTSLGGTLGVGEFSTITRLFADTSASLPENWDLHLAPSSLGIGAGTPITSLTTDFAGNPVTNPPSIGLFNFTATATTPILTTTSASGISYNNASSGGNISSDGGSPITRRGLMYSTSAITDTTTGTKVIDGSVGTGIYTTSLTGLTSSTLYHVRAFAVNSVGVSYGLDLTFTTLTLPTPIPPTVTYSGTTASSTSANVLGNVTNEGSSAVYRRGFIYSTSPMTNDTSLYSKVAINGGGTGFYAINITGLSLGTLYYVTAWAVSSAGISFSTNGTAFITQNYPSVTTTPATSITAVSAITGGSITDYGATIVSQRAVIYSTSPIVDTNSRVGGGIIYSPTSAITVYPITLTSLLPNTFYYYRAFVVNTVGVGLGNQLTFTTTNNTTLPIVTSISPISITSTSAIVGGEVKSDGNSLVYRRGFVYSTSHIIDTTSITGGGKIINGSGLGAYASTLTSLTPNTTYYVVAFAVNSIGVSYSPEAYFSTSASPLGTNSFRTRKRFVQKL